MKTVAIIPMRSGSKGIRDKNMVTFYGKALCRHTIEQAQVSKLDRIVVATDSQEYKERIDLWYGPGFVPFLLPDNLTTDRTTSDKYIPWVLDWLEQNDKVKYDRFVLLEPTSPLRCPGDINAALDQMEETNAPAALAVCDSHRCHPAISFRLSKKTKGYIKMPDTPHPIRQQLDPFYHPSGLLYAARIDWYREHLTFMTEETAAYVVKPWQDYEIDVPLDIWIGEAILKAKVRGDI
jgi:CMP-N,N'-diacetyllegionaminic acid synthase